MAARLKAAASPVRLTEAALIGLEARGYRIQELHVSASLRVFMEGLKFGESSFSGVPVEVHDEFPADGWYAVVSSGV